MIITRETKKTILKTIRKLRATPFKKNVPKNGTKKLSNTKPSKSYSLSGYLNSYFS